MKVREGRDVAIGDKYKEGFIHQLCCSSQSPVPKPKLKQGSSRMLYGKFLVGMRNQLTWLTSKKCSNSFNLGLNDLQNKVVQQYSAEVFHHSFKIRNEYLLNKRPELDVFVISGSHTGNDTLRKEKKGKKMSVLGQPFYFYRKEFISYYIYRNQERKKEFE